MSLGKLKVPYYVNVKSKKSYKNQFQVLFYLTTSNRIFKKKNKTQSVIKPDEQKLKRRSPSLLNCSFKKRSCLSIIPGSRNLFLFIFIINQLDRFVCNKLLRKLKLCQKGPKMVLEAR